MLGFGIGEIILIVVVAIIVLGPDKLPNALIEMAKLVKALKRTMQDAKETLDREVDLATIKREAELYKEKLEQSTNLSKDLHDAKLVDDIQKDMNDIAHLFQDYKPKPIELTSQKHEISQEQGENSAANAQDSHIQNHNIDTHDKNPQIDSTNAGKASKEQSHV